MCGGVGVLRDIRIKFSTANYLGRAYHPHVVAAAKEAIEPVRNVGAGGRRSARQVLMNAAIPRAALGARCSLDRTEQTLLAASGAPDASAAPASVGSER